MSVERSFEAWEEVQRQGQDLADRLAQGFTGLIHSHHIAPPSFPWKNQNQPKSKLFDIEFPRKNFGKRNFLLPNGNLGINGVSAILDIGSRIGQAGADFGAKNFLLSNDNLGINGVSAILDIGSRIGQAGADFGATMNGAVHQFFRQLPVPFKMDESGVSMFLVDANGNRQRACVSVKTEDLLLWDTEDDGSSNGLADEESMGFTLKSGGKLARPQGTVNITSTYDSRTNDVDSSLVARGDLWRVEAAHGSSTSGNDNSSLFLVQLGPLLFVRDSTLLLPVHLSKQHLVWYGYDRKNGMHSLCPAVWSKHRRWFLMSMLHLNPVACSFVDVQFPNGQLTYVSGEGLTTSAYLPVCGGLLQAQGQYPGEMKFSFACKNKWGTHITPTVQWPDKSFTMSIAQPLAWERSGLMVKPTIQVSVSPTFGGSNPGLRAELIHSVKEQLNLICGCALTTHPSAYASVSVGRSRWNGNVGNSGIVVRVDTPLSSVGRPSISVQINSGIEF